MQNDFVSRKAAIWCATDPFFLNLDEQERACLVSRLSDLPTADVAPVVHGAWEWYEQWSESNTDHPSGCDDCGWKCSECGSALSDSILEGIGETVYCDSFQDTPKMKVCPNCYARMDGGDHHAE